MNSKTGNQQIYEANEQRETKEQHQERYEAGPANAHRLNDPKDQRSLSNRAALEVREQQKEEEAEQNAIVGDPTAPAKSHGNKPSKGADIDAELQRDDELRMQEKGIKQ
ncbi:hypothetical protein PHLGIDRAFT_259454 [Phlebiopsis gigantea 11061_1 CR5-6]|uniref:Uncharacterized protein n=1 Tax=Phlebiopsis gigantea (strain 11061_1 CR5-6) TaxID=745531 RepID=A0A0C3PWR2_PHLG1|nr:hypothetical protein PHLGIDRAFT_259454 [Phlebiopsis gigantea 11061_1 CR5-6]